MLSDYFTHSISIFFYSEITIMAQWRHKSGSTLNQVMACCLIAGYTSLKLVLRLYTCHVIRIILHIPSLYFSIQKLPLWLNDDINLGQHWIRWWLVAWSQDIHHWNLFLGCTPVMLSDYFTHSISIFFYSEITIMAQWRHKSGSTLNQVMACCLIAGYTSLKLVLRLYTCHVIGLFYTFHLYIFLFRNYHYGSMTT